MSASKKTTPYRYSRTERKKILAKNPGFVILLKGPDKYWVYDEDAKQIADLFDAPIYSTRKGYGLTFEHSLHDEIAAELEARQIPYVTVYPMFEMVCSGPFTYPEPERIIEIGTVFVLKGLAGKCMKCMITGHTPTELIEIRHLDRTTEIVRKPILKEGDVTLISSRTAIANALIGKNVGDTVEAGDEQFTVVEIHAAAK